jgi:hypothetical protein
MNYEKYLNSFTMIIYLYNRQFCFVARLVGDHFLLRDFDPNVITFMNVLLLLLLQQLPR